MNICFLTPCQFISAGAGVKNQAIMWKNGLEKLGHHVDMIGSWETPQWGNYDAIIIFGFSSGIRNLIKYLYLENKNILLAPIIDPTTPPFLYKFFVKYWGFQKILGLSSRFHDLWLAKKFVNKWFVRSKEEYHYVKYCLEIDEKNIITIPLHYRIPPIEYFPNKMDFCFHASRLAAPNKNVARIIESAKKYGFSLKLAGHLKGETERNWLNNLIGSAKNIEYVGEVDDKTLQSLYKQAKVFVLPSLQEGVGMVALEAAAYGCEIVLTNYGAPKEYYNGKAILVNPKSTDEIGLGVLKALKQQYKEQKKILIKWLLQLSWKIKKKLMMRLKKQLKNKAEHERFEHRTSPSNNARYSKSFSSNLRKTRYQILHGWRNSTWSNQTQGVYSVG